MVSSNRSIKNPSLKIRILIQKLSFIRCSKIEQYCHWKEEEQNSCLFAKNPCEICDFVVNATSCDIQLDKHKMVCKVPDCEPWVRFF